MKNGTTKRLFRCFLFLQIVWKWIFLYLVFQMCWSVKKKNFDYDENGNLTHITQTTGESETVEKLRTNVWDEENHLRAVDITPDAEGVRPIAIYIYDAGGERILKHSNTSVSIYLNGKKVADTIQTDATIYPSGMLVARVIPPLVRDCIAFLD